MAASCRTDKRLCLPLRVPGQPPAASDPEGEAVSPPSGPRLDLPVLQNELGASARQKPALRTHSFLPPPRSTTVLKPRVPGNKESGSLPFPSGFEIPLTLF